MVALLPDPPAATAPPVVDDAEPRPDDGDENGDGVELVRTGLVRVRIGGRRYRLRRPFFGELKAVVLQWNEIADELGDASIEAAAEARRLQDELAAVTNDDTMSHDGRAQATLELRRRDRATGRKLSQMGDDLRVEWWQDVFTRLSLDGTPDDWPGWIVDGTLPQRVIGHWRSAPLARG